MRCSKQLATLALASVACGKSTPAVPQGGAIGTATEIENGGQVSLTLASISPPSPSWAEVVDFGELREAYGLRVDYGERCESPERRDASSALLAEEFARVVELTEPLLANCPVDASAHLWRAAALRSLGREEEGAIHRRWYLGLIESILKSGDGTTPESPYVTISVSEEYQVLAHLNLNPIQQLSINSPAMLDAISVEDSSGATRTVYFNPSLHYLRLIHQLQ